MSSLICQTMLIGFLISFASAYLEIDIQRVEQLGGTEYLDFSKIKVRKDKESRTNKFYGNLSINIEMDNSFKETVLIYAKQGGEYRKMPYKIPENGICDLINEDEYVYPELVATSNFPATVPCPLPKGTYEIRGFQPSLKNFPKVIMKTGEYAAESTITKDGEVVFQEKVYLSIIRI